MNTDEDDNTPDELLPDDDEPTADEDEDNLICEINLYSENYRLCKTTTAHDTVLGKNDASLPKKTLTAAEAPLLNTKAEIRYKKKLLKLLFLMSPPFGQTNQRSSSWQGLVLVRQKDLAQSKITRG